MSNSVLNTENDSFIEYYINRVLNLDNSYISYKGEQTEPLKLLLYVFYQTHNFTAFTDEIKGSVTVSFPVTSMCDVKLSAFINYTLKGKQIKRIITDFKEGYLDLFSKNERLENVPLNLFTIKSSKEFYVDNLLIDFEKSYLRVRSMKDVETIKITFIY